MTTEEYIQGVISGDIVTGELARLAVERHVADLGRQIESGVHYDRRQADRAVRFIERLRHTKG